MHSSAESKARRHGSPNIIETWQAPDRTVPEYYRRDVSRGGLKSIHKMWPWAEPHSERKFGGESHVLESSDETGDGAQR